MTRGKRVIGPEVRQAMKKILQDIQSGQFAEEWINEYKCGMPHFTELEKKQAIIRWKKSAPVCDP